MYTIYVGNTLLDDGKSFDTNEQLLYSPTLIYEGYAILNPKLTLELNKAGSLTFLLPPSNPLYNKIQKLKSIITVYQDGEEIFRGRVLHDTRDFYNRKDIYCEGELSFLLDSIVTPETRDVIDMVKGTLGRLLTVHNSETDEYKHFEVGDVTVDYGNPEKGTIEFTGYPNVLEEINSRLIEPYGGYLRTRVDENGKRRLDWLKSDDNPIDQTIEFGVNLLDISEYISADEVFTVLIPLGTPPSDSSDGSDSGDDFTIPECPTCNTYLHMQYDGNGQYTCEECGSIVTRETNISDPSSKEITISDIPENYSGIPEGIKKKAMYIEDEAASALYGRIWRVEKFSDVIDAYDLMRRGVKYLQDNIESAISLTIKAIDLHILNVDTERIKIGSRVRVMSPPHNIDDLFECSKISIDLVSPDKTEFTLGSSHKTLTENQANTSKNVQNTVNVVEKAANKANQAADNVNKKLTSESIFKLLTNNGKAQGIVRDENSNIYINASYIKSGTLTLGGDNPLMDVVNEDGNVCVRVSEDGIHILDGEINATSGSLENMTIVNGITISSKNDSNAKDMSLVSIEKVEDSDYGTYYRIAFGESSNKTTPMVFYGSTIEFVASSGLEFTADNIIFNGSVEVSDIYVNKPWTKLNLLNNFEYRNFEAKQLEYKTIGKHVYIRGAVKFPDGASWNGSNTPIATLPSVITPSYNHYELKSCGGARVARVLASTSGHLTLEWIRLLSNGANDTSGTGLWISMNMDYWID